MNDAEQWLAEYKAKIAAREKVNAARQKEAAALRAATAAATATVSSPDGSVTATVDIEGRVRDLRLGPQALSNNPARLASLMMRTVIDARRAAGEQLIEVYEQTETGAAAADTLRARVAALETPGAEIPANAFDQLAADEPEPAPPQPPARPTWPTPPRAPARRPRPARAAHDDPDDFSEEKPW